MEYVIFIQTDAHLGGNYLSTLSPLVHIIGPCVKWRTSPKKPCGLLVQIQCIPQYPHRTQTLSTRYAKPWCYCVNPYLTFVADSTGRNLLGNCWVAEKTPRFTHGGATSPLIWPVFFSGAKTVYYDTNVHQITVFTNLFLFSNSFCPLSCSTYWANDQHWRYIEGERTDTGTSQGTWLDSTNDLQKWISCIWLRVKQIPPPALL